MNALAHGQRTTKLAAAAAALALVTACGNRGGDEPDAPSPTAEPARAGQAGGGTRDVALATFAANVPDDAEDTQGRLPAAGDAAIYVPATTLFPGAARLEPDVPNPYSGDADAIAAGERHFAAFNCAGCHAPLGGGGMGPPLSDDTWIYGGEPAQIYMSIMHGRPEGMPAWSSMLPRRTTWELVAYIGTLDEIDDYAAEKGFGGGPRFTEGGAGAAAERADRGISIRSDAETTQ